MKYVAVALKADKTFLGFVDSKGRVHKSKVRRVNGFFSDIWAAPPERKQKKYKSGRSILTITEALHKAYQAGQRSGDTFLFDDWLTRNKLDGRGVGLVNKLEKEYRRGVDNEEPSKENKKDSKKVDKAKDKELRNEVVEALVSQGEKHSIATKLVKKAKGETFDSLFRSALDKAYGR